MVQDSPIRREQCSRQAIVEIFLAVGRLASERQWCVPEVLCHESHGNAFERQSVAKLSTVSQEIGLSGLASGKSGSAGRQGSALKAEQLATCHCMLQITVYRVLEGR